MEAPTQPDLSDLLNEVSADAKQFWHAQRDYTILVASEKVAKVGRSMVGGVMALALVSITVLMLSLAAAYRIGELLESVALGFLCVGGAYLVLLALFFLLWKTLLGDKVQLGLINALHDND
jgi:Na+/H+-dicarboxylate symporter